MSANCRSCGAQIVFVATSTGKKMPCEVDPIDPTDATDGDFYITEEGLTIKFDSVKTTHQMLEQLWVPHWGNCSGADSFRGGK